MPKTVSSSSSCSSSPCQKMVFVDLKILTSLRADTKLKSYLKEVLRTSTLFKYSYKLSRMDLQSIRQLFTLKLINKTVTDMEQGLSTSLDDVITLQTTVGEFETDMASLRDQYVNLESRMRRFNIRIMGVAGDPGLSSTTSVSKLLKEALKMDLSHRSLQSRKPGRKPCVIEAKLHYYQDCVEFGPLRFNRAPIFILANSFPSSACDQAAFNDMKSLLWFQMALRNCSKTQKRRWLL